MGAFAHASNVSSFSDTLSTSAPTTAATHTIKFTTPSGVNLTASGTIAVTLTSFTLSPSLGLSDLALGINSTTSTTTLAATCSGTTWGVATTTTSVTFTPCNGTVTAGNFVYIKIGGTTNKVTNPAAGAYQITVGGTMADSGTTMVAIISTVTMTAAVSTAFTFTITGVAAGQTSANGESSPSTTTVATTATSVPWGTLTAGAANAETARQDLAVTTNATNGFTVTIQENQPLTAGTGAVIYNFANGTNTATPTAWSSPSKTIGSPMTYGHMGVTSSSTEGTSEFISAKYVGNIQAAPRTIMSYSGPSDGTVNDKGLTQVGFKIEITSLQAAGNDYTNVLTYVATPVF